MENGIQQVFKYSMFSCILLFKSEADFQKQGDDAFVEDGYHQFSYFAEDGGFGFLRLVPSHRHLCRRECV